MEVETLREKMKSPPVEERDADEQEMREREGSLENIIIEYYEYRKFVYT